MDVSGYQNGWSSKRPLTPRNRKRTDIISQWDINNLTDQNVVWKIQATCLSVWVKHLNIISSTLGLDNWVSSRKALDGFPLQWVNLLVELWISWSYSNNMMLGSSIHWPLCKVLRGASGEFSIFVNQIKSLTLRKPTGPSAGENRELSICILFYTYTLRLRTQVIKIQCWIFYHMEDLNVSSRGS